METQSFQNTEIWFNFFLVFHRAENYLKSAIANKLY